MVKIFCLKHEIELELDDQGYYCSECDDYPSIQDIYATLEIDEIIRYNENATIYFDDLENMKAGKQ